MNTHRWLSVIIVLILLAVVAADAKESGKSRLLRYEAFASVAIPVEYGTEEAIGALDYLPGESPLVLQIDLNGDGFEDIFLATPNFRLCGTAGCPYMLVEGKSKELIGEFFGMLALTAIKINGFPVIHAVSKRDMYSTNLHIYVYNGTKYAVVGHALLESKGIGEWWNTLESSEEPKK